MYRGLDVGSAKLPPAQREGVAHHMLDVVPPGVEYSVGDWADGAVAAAADIAARGKTPIVVGGAGLYLRWCVASRSAAAPPAPASLSCHALSRVARCRLVGGKPQTPRSTE